MKRSAEISDCGKFRWWLQRRWSDGPLVCFVMLNPSVADGLIDDPTIRRCIGFAQAWGFGGLSVRNLYPFRATKPRYLKLAMKTIDVAGGERGANELRAARSADLVIAAWGANATDEGQRRGIALTHPAPLWCLGKTQDGRPLHPLMQPSHLEPVPFLRCEGDIRGRPTKRPAHA